MQVQPPGDVLKKRCSENMQQIYRSASMPKCDFNKYHTSAWVFSCKFVHTFRTPVPKKTSGWLLLKMYVTKTYLLFWDAFNKGTLYNTT